MLMISEFISFMLLRVHLERFKSSFTMVLELVPIGTILAVLTTQVLKTAQAAKDVLIEKDSFKVMSKHLFDIEPVLKLLQLRKLNDSQAARQALEALEEDVKKAHILVEKYKNRSRFYLLVRCRVIVHEAQEVTRKLGRSLAALSLASTDLLMGISDQVEKLHNEMQRVEFEAPQSQLKIVERLNQGLLNQKLDQGFANYMLEEIARAVGVPVEPSEISKELASFRREKEEAANRKERQEELFLEQVIELLSRADAARDYEESKRRYFQRLKVIEQYGPREEYIAPLAAFLCRINGTVMSDPVSLSTGTTCERAAVEAWFESGAKIDPETGEVLEDTRFWPNFSLRKSIEEWRELNYCLRIRVISEMLLSGDKLVVEEALSQMQHLLRENPINQDWISIGGLTDIVISILEISRDKDVKRKILITLKSIVEGHARNKERVVEHGGWDHIVPCFVSDLSFSKEAVELLFELLQERSGWNVSFCRKLSRQSSAILFLVTTMNGPLKEPAVYAENILHKLFEIDEENICRAAKLGWYKPLIDRILQGSCVSLLRALVSMVLAESELKLLGEQGIIPPLLEMVTSGDFESKELSLSLMVKLSGCRSNKDRIAAAGGLPVILGLMSSPHGRTGLVIKCSEILEKLSSDGDGIKYLVDGNGSQLELEPIICNLLTLQWKAHNARRPALYALLWICKNDSEAVKTAVLTANGIPSVLAILDNADSEVRGAAMNLLSLLSHHEPQGVVEYLLKPKRIEALAGFLENADKVDLQIAAAALLANLPKSEVILTRKLIELEGHNAIINITRTGTMEAIENALDALFRFTDPMNLEAQRIVVEQGAYPLLVGLLGTGSITAKARAAALIGDLSRSTPKLVATQSIGCWYVRPQSCAAHGGICSVRTTFCLLQANALGGLVKLLEGQVHATAQEAIQTLSTLVQERSPHRGANVLHQAKAIKPILHVLTWGTDSLKEEALGLLEKILSNRAMVDHYGSTTKPLLFGLTGRKVQNDGRLGSKAARVLTLLDRYSRSTRMLYPGLMVNNVL